MYLSAFLTIFIVISLCLCFLIFIRRLTVTHKVCWLKTALVTVLAFLCFPALAQSEWAGWPSPDENDGKFLAITGPQSAIEYVAPEIIIGIPSTATRFDIELLMVMQVHHSAVSTILMSAPQGIPTLCLKTRIKMEQAIQY